MNGLQQVQDGQEVGSHVRYERMASKKTKLKFMTDGILLRELQADFLLRQRPAAHALDPFCDLVEELPRLVLTALGSGGVEQYSCIVVDEAHERSLNTDILIGNLSRIVPLRQKLFEQQRPAPPGDEAERVMPLKLIIMSATLRVDDFLGNQRLGANGGEPSAEGEQSEAAQGGGPVLVLPLYAMLPPNKQRLVFEPVPEGTRLIVVATNVAETSLTIPGIRYVVDAGRAKVRSFERGGGLSRYEVEWVSKASAAQRAGRAGRTGPGHCYRLYSSAHFQRSFPEFAPAEIEEVPLEGVVLQLRSMAIDNVRNFPFPTAPEPADLVMAEQTLIRLGALERGGKGKITELGARMARFPVSPRHSRMLLAALELEESRGLKGCVALAVITAAAISQESPFTTGDSSNAEEGEKSKEKSEEGEEDEDAEGTRGSEDVKQLELKKRHKEAHHRFIHPQSDALSVACALEWYDAAPEPHAFCQQSFLHGKTMREMSDLRQQLQHILSSHIGFRISDADGKDTAEGVEGLERGEAHSMEKDTAVVEAVRRALCCGWGDRVARRIKADKDLDRGRKGKRAVRYAACNTEETVFLHPTSALAHHAPEYVVYTELLATEKRAYMMHTSAVEASWLAHHAPAMCTFSSPVDDPSPWYDAVRDEVRCFIRASFGLHNWELPLHAVPLVEHDAKAAPAVFATYLLEGKVFKALASLKKESLFALQPATIRRPEGKSQVRVLNLLEPLQRERVSSKAALAQHLQRNPTFLKSQIGAWLKAGTEGVLEGIWLKVQQEAKKFCKKEAARSEGASNVSVGPAATLSSTSPSPKPVAKAAKSIANTAAMQEDPPRQDAAAEDGFLVVQGKKRQRPKSTSKTNKKSKKV
ncbi:hypothetical protein CYMTET_29120 [Cymbomonas tetramitiformis]|uniref:RNA helicase n=1 Tax=Cymbomonas tetramitiformis TaxID=36881 RepID=A0AAE0FLN7_9CHLO|nr:hypothetical protein CYMTET_29120 [Cymbomonas tetramitiformis]